MSEHAEIAKRLRRQAVEAERRASRARDWLASRQAVLADAHSDLAKHEAEVARLSAAAAALDPTAGPDREADALDALAEHRGVDTPP